MKNPREHEPTSQVAGCPQFRRAVGPLSRRAVLEAGALSVLGLHLPRLWAAQAPAAAAPTASSFGRARRCIFLFMWGGPSQLDTFDLKPEAPETIRGPFQPIATPVPGLQVCEHFAEVARLADRLAVIRSLTHTDPAHLSSAHHTLTGQLAPVVNSDAQPPSQRDTPHLGSVVARLRPGGSDLPKFVTLPWITSHPAAPGGQAPGQNAGWLGRGYDPMVIAGDPNQANWQISELTLAAGVDAARFERRRDLLAALDAQRRRIDLAAAAELDAHQQTAFGLLAGSAARAAFDLAQEADAVRDRYGRNIHGQSVLLARRLIEHGVPLVSVNWHNDGRNFWDTHGNNFKRLERDLIPPADRALAALLSDLDERGLLDETIVAWVGEFGRKPVIDAGSAGRDHWPYCYSGLLAGGGIRGGALYGASDRHAARPAEAPVSPADYAATIYHALGIDVSSTLHDQGGRPHRIGEGRPLVELFG